MKNVYSVIVSTSPFNLKLDQWLRTIIVYYNFTVDHDDYTNYSFDSEFHYYLCGTAEEKDGGKHHIQLEGNKCVHLQNLPLKDEEIVFDFHVHFRSPGWSIKNNRKYDVWITIALSANDQLHQRVA